MNLNLNSSSFSEDKEEEMEPVYVAPGQTIPQELLNQLKQINNSYSISRYFPLYKEKLEKLFRVKPGNDSKELSTFLGGFVSGDGSLNVSAKKQSTAKFKLVLDPEFSATQHVNGVDELIKLLAVLRTGRISYKTGSKATMVLTVGARKSLEEKVVPFYEQYVYPHCSPIKRKRFLIFKKLLNLFKEQAHSDKDRFINEMLPLWNQMRIQTGQTNQTFETLEEAQEYVRKESRLR
jgi:hypothetical protein